MSRLPVVFGAGAASAAWRRALHASASLNARVLCSDPIDGVCPDILKSRGHTVDLAGDKPIPAAELKKVIGNYDALVIRRCVSAFVPLPRQLHVALQHSCGFARVHCGGVVGTAVLLVHGRVGVSPPQLPTRKIAGRVSCRLPCRATHAVVVVRGGGRHETAARRSQPTSWQRRRS